METKISSVSDNYRYSMEKQNVGKSSKSSSDEKSGDDQSELKILIAQLSAATTSFEASMCLTKIKAALSKIQGSSENLPLINKVKKIIQNGNKKVAQLREEEALEAEKKKAEINNDKDTASEIDNNLQTKRRRRTAKENNELPKTGDIGNIHFEDIKVSLGADFDVLA